MIYSTTAGYASDYRTILFEIFNAYLSVYALILSYYYAGRIDIEKGYVLVSCIAMTNQMLFDGCIDVWIAIVSMVYEYHLVNIRDLAKQNEKV